MGARLRTSVESASTLIGNDRRQARKQQDARSAPCTDGVRNARFPGAAACPTDREHAAASGSLDTRASRSWCFSAATDLFFTRRGAAPSLTPRCLRPRVPPLRSTLYLIADTLRCVEYAGSMRRSNGCDCRIDSFASSRHEQLMEP